MDDVFSCCDKQLSSTKHSTFRLKEKREERGSVQTLNNIPLRSMLFNAGVTLKKR